MLELVIGCLVSVLGLEEETVVVGVDRADGGLVLGGDESEG